MEFIKTKIDGVVIVEPKVFGDHRGFFMESYSKREFEKAGLFYDFVQDNHSSSTVKGTLRGIHFQRGDKAQAKLVRCARGAVLDVAVDLRPASPTYKQWVAVELSEVLVMVRIRFQMVVGSSGTHTTQATAKAGISFGFQRNTNTTAAQAMPTQLARE